ncbi:lipopolysaccharide export LptBFGC system permease protein LptF [Shimia isoporae]|uniref:Lipopolysaccharide export LptBFGC system permease protein LptF n=1 Tax=Shimia isoporae TaxID=647720 RepID=A0A4R1N5Y8_9RHOB|nr:LptF/LptG family permease [Shimia isoporae]TCL01530.1 lipopolysaccharide export LptBFGC system permease protein LptF [Shimia isoporae]
MSVFRPFLRQPVLRILGWPILWRLLLIVGVVEAIFLAEEFTGLMQLALRNDGPLSVIGKMLIFRIPEIFDLALAFGLLIAVYFAVGEARDNGELVVLATAGIPWWRVVTLVSAIGLGGGVLGLLNAGYLLPLSNFAERVTVAELRKDYVLNKIQTPGDKVAIQTIKDTTFIASPPDEAGQGKNGNLFVYQRNVGGVWRAASSRNWQVSGQDNDRHIILLEELVAHDVALNSTVEPPPMNRYAVKAADFNFSMSEVAPDVDRTPLQAEKLLTFHRDETPRIANIAARALMVPLAGLLALAALVAGRTTLRRIVALPLAAVVMLSVDVVAKAIVVSWASLLPPGLVAANALFFYLAPPLIYLGLRKEALMKPAGRTE